LLTELLKQSFAATFCHRTLQYVIPAKAGTYNTFPKSLILMTHGGMLWVPACAGMTV